MYSELEIIEKCIKGSKEAQKVLYKQYSPVMFAICMRYASSKAEAEDVLQEGFLKVFLNIANYREKGSFVSWMKKIFINTSITIYHKNRKHRFHVNIDETQEFLAPTTNNKISGYFTKDELLNIINSLPDGYRIVFNLYAVEGYKHREIAKLLNIDVNTSKSQYSRARKLIQKKLIRLDSEIAKVMYQ